MPEEDKDVGDIEDEEYLKRKQLLEERIKEEGSLIRKRTNIEFKMLNKYGNQVKDEGINFLQWSIKSLNNTTSAEAYQ